MVRAGYTRKYNGSNYRAFYSLLNYKYIFFMKKLPPVMKNSMTRRCEEILYIFKKEKISLKLRKSIKSVIQFYFH